MDARHAVSALCLLSVSLCSVFGADWENSVTAGPAGPFPPPRSLHASYHFGWAGFTAATAEARFIKRGDRFQLDGTAHTIGLARALWKMDATHHAVADARRLRPISMSQVESIRSKKIDTKLAFTSTGVTRIRTDSKAGKTPPKPKQTHLANLFDLHSSLLYIRSQALRQGDVQRIVVYPAASPYLATITVLGREKLSIRAGTFNTIKLDLKLKKVNKKGELEPHRKFRRSTIWISDDQDRMLLRIEAQIFVGTVFAELRSVHFQDSHQGIHSPR
jgi:hypothetical protein